MDQPEGKTVNSVRSLFTRPKANEGVVLEIKDDEGKPTGAWIRVRGVDSDAVQTALLDFAREKTSPIAGDAVKPISRPFDDPAVISSMIASWSFDDPCTPDTAKELLVEAPYLRPYVVNLAFERARFLPQSASDSSSTLKPNSD